MPREFKFFYIMFTLIIIAGGVVGCEQWKARTGFGTMQAKVPCGQKLVNATWKGDNMELWTLTRPMRYGEAPETSNFKASTLYGILQGEVVFTESKC